MLHPFGLMIDDKPWIRSPQRVLPDGGLRFYARVLEDEQIDVMQSTDLVADTAGSIARARSELKGQLSGGLAFNCVLRRLELDAGNRHGAFLATFGSTPVAGFHTYGESWLGHVNQTLTALWFG